MQPETAHNVEKEETSVPMAHFMSARDPIEGKIGPGPSKQCPARVFFANSSAKKTCADTFLRTKTTFSVPADLIRHECLELRRMPLKK